MNITKFLIFIIFSFFSIGIYSQDFCDCDLVYKDTTYSGFCFEYLNDKLFPVFNKTKSHFKCLIYYNKGKKAKIYSNYFYIRPKIEYSDSITLLNGIYKDFNRKGETINELYYKNGFVIKDIHTRSGKRYPELIEIAQYDYKLIAPKLHYMRYNKKGFIKYNVYITYVNGKRNIEWTKDIISPEIIEN